VIIGSTRPIASFATRPSRLPELVELVMARPLISAGMVAKTLEVTPQGARRIVQELGLREMTGRGRFRAWGVV